MLVTLRVDANRCDQNRILVHVNAVDLDHQQIETGKFGCHPLLHVRRRDSSSLRCPEKSESIRYRVPA
jgi:hypothetical protein